MPWRYELSSSNFHPRFTNIKCKGKKKSRRRGEWKPELLLLLELLQSTKTLDVFAVLLRRASVSFSFQANIGCVDFACFYASRG